MRAATVAVAAVGLLALAAAPAVADHVYSHRYLVFGSVVDADGMPLEGVSLNFDFGEFSDHEGPCAQEGSGGADRQKDTTDAMGRYFHCAHIHTSGSSQHDFRVQAGGPVATHTVTVTSDPDLRRSNVNIQLDQAYPDQRGDTDAWAQSYQVRGIVWQPEDTRLDGISVGGIALTYESVEATITTSDGTTHEGDFVQSPWNTPRYNPQLRETRTNVSDRYGDFIFRWDDLPEDLAGGEVTVSTPDESVTEPLDPTQRYSTANVILPGEGPNFTVLWVLGGLLVLGAGGYFAYGPIQEKLEERRRERRMEKLEKESNRKRS